MAGILLPGNAKRLEKKACCSTNTSPTEKNEQICEAKTEKVKPNKKSRKPTQ